MNDSIITRNILSRLGAKVICYALGFIASILLVRYLGVERLGKYNYASTFAALTGFLGGLGLPILLTREVARDKASAGALLGATMVLQYGLSSLTLVSIVVSGAIFNSMELALPIAIIGLGVAMNALGAPYLAMLNAFEAMHVSSAIEVACIVLHVGLIFTAMYLRLDVTGLVAILLINPVVSFALTKHASDRYCAPPRYTYDPTRLKGLLISTVPFALMVILNNVYFRIDIIMLEKMRGLAAVGIYTAAYKFLDILMIIGANITGVLYPRMASEAAGAPRTLQRIIEKSYRYMVALGIPTAVVVTILAQRIIRILFGEQFSASASALRILIWAIPPMFMYMPLAHALNATGGEWPRILVLSVNTLANIGMNLLLIPVFSFVGAAFSTVICEVISLILLARLVRRTCQVGYLPAAIPVLASTLVMGLAVWYLRDTHLLIALPFGAFVYCATLYLAGFLTPEEKLALRQLFALGSAR